MTPRRQTSLRSTVTIATTSFSNQFGVQSSRWTPRNRLCEESYPSSVVLLANVLPSSPPWQIIDIRIKQLQEAHPENLYFDTSFFSFLCSTTEKVGRRFLWRSQILLGAKLEEENGRCAVDHYGGHISFWGHTEFSPSDERYVSQKTSSPNR